MNAKKAGLFVLFMALPLVPSVLLTPGGQKMFVE